MYKYFTLLFLFFTVGLFAQDITATQKIPANAMPGTEFIIETTIYKAGVTGFMKFFQEIPEGLTATEIESRSGAFTFADGGAKIIWISPPTDQVFTISYKVTVNGGVTGRKALPAKISYVNNNERKVFDLPAAGIQIGLASAPVQKAIPSTNPTTSSPSVKSDPVTTQPVKTAPVVTTQPSTTSAPVATTPTKTTPPAQKEIPPSATPATFTKVPTTALPTSAGKMYRVQFGAYAAKPKIEGVTEMTTVVLENGITKYFSGNFTTYEDAVKRKKEMLDKGFQGAFIVSFENGKIVK